MERSVLLQLARDSIAEVFEAKRMIKKQELTQQYPLLLETDTPVKVALYLDDTLRGMSAIHQGTIIEDIILNAKKAAFEDKNFSPLSVSDYLSCKLELTLTTPEGIISEIDDTLLEYFEKKNQEYQ